MGSNIIMNINCNCCRKFWFDESYGARRPESYAYLQCRSYSFRFGACQSIEHAIYYLNTTVLKEATTFAERVKKFQR